MATLEELERTNRLSRYRPKRLKRDQFEERQLWFYSEAVEWLMNEVSGMEPFYSGDLRPSLQANALLKQFVLGEPFEHKRMFWKMRPDTKDVFELKTADLRMFGWFVRPKVFVVAEYATFEQTHAAKGIHEYYRDRVVAKREALPLDDPKCVVGAGPEDVF